MNSCKSLLPVAVGAFEQSEPSSIPNSSNASERIRDILQRSCDYCKLAKRDLLQCSRCMNVRYCNIECQKSAWKTHKIICGHPFIPKGNEIVCLFHEADGVKKISQRQFQELTDSIFTIAPLNLRAPSPSHALPKLNLDSIALYYAGKEIGCGLKANKAIELGDIICSFGGEIALSNDWAAKLQSHRSHLTAIHGDNCIFDPFRYANLGAYVNDGPPNCELQTYYRGNYLDKVLVAIREIQEGEIVYIDYGWTHPIKQAPYLIDQNALERLQQRYGECLDITILNKTGWVCSALDSSLIASSELLKAAEIIYIMTTPSVLAQLHLTTSINPLTTLQSLTMVSSQIRNKFPDEFKSASLILTALSKIKDTDKKEFSKLVSTLSQRSLKILAQLLATLPSGQSLENCAILAKALDNLMLLCHGTMNGTLWNTTERAVFEKQFDSKIQQEKIFDNTVIQHLPIEFQNYYIKAREFNLNYVDLIKRQRSG